MISRTFLVSDSDHDFVNNKNENGDNLLIQYCGLNHAIVVDSLLKYSSDQVRQKLIKETNKYGKKAIHIACIFSNLEIVSNLVKRGANPKENDIKGIPPYYYAFLKGNTEVLDYILNKVSWDEDEALFFDQRSYRQMLCME